MFISSCLGFVLTGQKRCSGTFARLQKGIFLSKDSIILLLILAIEELVFVYYLFFILGFSALPSTAPVTGQAVQSADSEGLAIRRTRRGAGSWLLLPEGYSALLQAVGYQGRG